MERAETTRGAAGGKLSEASVVPVSRPCRQIAVPPDATAKPGSLPTELNELRVLLRDAMDVLSAATRHDANALFGGRVFEPADRSPTAAHAMGVVEGAAVALGVTALELLAEMGL